MARTKQKAKRTTKKRVARKTKIVADKPLPLSKCENMTVKQIRQTKEYKGLTPLGKANPSGTYRYGHKSTMRKAELCRVLANPSMYHSANLELKEAKKPYGARKRESRKGECLVAKRKIPCDDPVYKFQGVTTTGKPCCFKKQMKQKTINKRLANVAKAIKDQNKTAAKKAKRGRKKSKK